MTREQYMERMLRGLENEPEAPTRVGHAFHVAAATAPTQQMLMALIAVYEAVMLRDDERALIRLGDGIQEALRLNADYISEDQHEQERKV